MRQKARGFLVVALFLACLLIWPALAGAAGAGTFEEIMDYVRKIHISNPREEVLYEGAIRGLIDSLDDPYAAYMSPDEMEQFNISLQGTFVGVGIELVPGESYPSVLRTIEGSPAENAGIKAGDMVIKVDGVDIIKESLPDVVQKIRGPDGTKVQLTIRRAGRGDFDVELLRTNINLPSVQSELLAGGIGYINISSFSSSTATELEKSLTSLKNDGAEKLILDLRDDPGGYLQTAVQIAGYFLGRDKLVVSTIDHNNKREPYYTDTDPIFNSVPVAVLVNSGSASASEILAGALQDYGVATLVGDRTFGKGTVQTVILLKDGGALKLTTARYHTPRDRVIDHTGLMPDIQVLTPELQLEAAKMWLLQPAGRTVVFKDGSAEALVNGEPVKLTSVPLQQGGAIYLPLRFVFEALGYRVDWQPAEGSVKVTDVQSEVVFYPGENGRTLSGGQEITGVGPLLVNNEVTYVPLAALKLFNLKIEAGNGKITIEK